MARQARVLEDVRENTPATETENAPESANSNKKTAKAFILYVDPDGKTFNSPHESAVILRTEFANKVTREFDVRNVKENVAKCAVLQGIATRLQRSYQSVKEIDSVINEYDETVADLNNGIWIESKAGQPRVTLLATAVRLSLEAAGQTVDDERMAGILEKLKSTNNVEKAMANENVKMHLANLKLAAMQERAQEARKAAKGKENVVDFA
jgi:hypothetical protein